jgi:hypothetical protein
MGTTIVALAVLLVVSEIRIAISARGLVPVHGEPAFGPVDRQQEQQRRGDDRHGALVESVEEVRVDGGFLTGDQRDDTRQLSRGSAQPPTATR